MKNHSKNVPEIVMHFGATHNSITVDGVIFDRAQMTRSEFFKFRSLLTQALTELGLVKTRGENYKLPHKERRQRERTKERRQKKRVREHHLFMDEVGIHDPNY